MSIGRRDRTTAPRRRRAARGASGAARSPRRSDAAAAALIRAKAAPQEPVMPHRRPSPATAARPTDSTIDDIARPCTRRARAAAHRRDRRRARCRHDADRDRAGAGAGAQRPRRAGRSRVRLRRTSRDLRRSARPGIADLVRGTASFGQIITRDRDLARASGRRPGRSATMPPRSIKSERLGVAIDALSRSYDHLVIDAGAQPELRAAGSRGCALRACWSRAGRAGRRAKRVRDQLRMPASATSRCSPARRRRSMPRRMRERRRLMRRGGSILAGLKKVVLRTGDGGAVFQRRASAAAAAARRRRRDPDAASRAAAAADAFQPNRLLEVTPEFLERRDRGGCAARASISSRSTRCTAG